MSWDRTEYEEFAPCACGKGKVIRRLYREDDDWSRSSEGIINEEIICHYCNQKYHIEHYIKHYFCPSWVGDGISDKTYLIPNGMTILLNTDKKIFAFRTDEKIVSEYPLEEISKAKEDMIQNKYSTRLKLKSSKEIVSIYYYYYQKKSLPPIIAMLEQIEHSYDKYEWKYERLTAFRKEEEIKIERNKQQIEKVLKLSYELNFMR